MLSSGPPGAISFYRQLVDRSAVMMAGARRAVPRVLSVLDRPKLWRVTAALSALLLCGLVLAASRGSIDVISTRPVATKHSAAPRPSWLRWCSHGTVRQDRPLLAYCARIDGLVVASNRGAGPGEAHLAVLSDFHLVIFRMPDGSTVPSIGTRLVAVGPLVRARNGQRELQVFKINPR